MGAYAHMRIHMHMLHTFKPPLTLLQWQTITVWSSAPGAPLLATIVARLGTEKHRLAVPTRESEAFLSEIAESKGGNRQISAGAPLDSPKLAER